MSTTTVTPKLPADQLPIVPEIQFIEPLVQCGVLYLGTAPSSHGRHGLNSIQEPFSHRYPVDGTNTARGIDAVLSVYDNGIQLTFTRHPHAVVFFPLTSLIYCASLRFSIIENDQTKPTSAVDWRFMPLDEVPVSNDNKHPPLFCIVTRRTQILQGDECHCFITKSVDAALALVLTVSQVYGNLKPGTKCLKSPIFYQLDCFGRKLSETTGIIYLSPANDDESQSNRSRNESRTRHCLLDSSLDGFFYRTDGSLIEQWQLWDNDHLTGSRPHPPASPFGLHEGLYHDDTTAEIQRYLRQMDDEKHSCSCTDSSKSSSSVSSRSTEYSRWQNNYRPNKQKSTDDDDSDDQFNGSFSNLQASSFEPVLRQNKIKKTKKRHAPIIIEKVVPNPNRSIPILNPKLPQQLLDKSLQDSNKKYTLPFDVSSASYRLNERGEKITKAGNRIVYMDVIRPNTNKNQINPQPYATSRSYRQRSSRYIPVLDIESVNRLHIEDKSKIRRRSLGTDEKSNDDLTSANRLKTADMFEILDRYFEDYRGHKTKLNKHEVQPILDRLESSKKKAQRKNSSIPSIDSSKTRVRHRRSHSTSTAGPLANYGERPSVQPVSPNPTVQQKSPPTPPALTDERLNEYVSNIYGIDRSIKSSSTSTDHQQIQQLDNTAALNAAYLSAFQYTQNNVNPNLIREYRNAY